MMTPIIYRSRNPEQESGPLFYPARGATLNILVRSFSCGECHRRKQKVGKYSFN
jgi:hypothetical protein